MFKGTILGNPFDSIYFIFKSEKTQLNWAYLKVKKKKISRRL